MASTGTWAKQLLKMVASQLVMLRPPNEAHISVTMPSLEGELGVFGNNLVRPLRSGCRQSTDRYGSLSSLSHALRKA
jgi:hypothetical protein